MEFNSREAFRINNLTLSSTFFRYEEELKLLFVFHSLFTTCVCTHIRKIKTIIYLPEFSLRIGLQPPCSFVYRRFQIIYGLSAIILAFVPNISHMSLQVLEGSNRKTQ